MITLFIIFLVLVIAAIVVAITGASVLAVFGDFIVAGLILYLIYKCIVHRKDKDETTK